MISLSLLGFKCLSRQVKILADRGRSLENPSQGIPKRASNSSKVMQKAQAAESSPTGSLGLPPPWILVRRQRSFLPELNQLPSPTIQSGRRNFLGEDQSFSELVLYSIRYTSGGDLTYALLQQMWGMRLRQVAGSNWRTSSGRLGQFRSRPQKPNIAFLGVLKEETGFKVSSTCITDAIRSLDVSAPQDVSAPTKLDVSAPRAGRFGPWVFLFTNI